MKKYKNKPWTERERKHLTQYYHHASIDEMCDMLPDRTEQSVRNQVNYLKKRGIRFK
jgi:DNA polymerase II small subunit/DNA polymerase delta subunit B